MLLSASPTDQALAQHKIIEGPASHGALQWPEYIATEFGWFKKKGLEVDGLVAGRRRRPAGCGRRPEYRLQRIPDFIRATNAGAPVKIVINAIGQPPYGVYSKPAIKKISDLKGKIASIGGQRDIMLIYMEAFLAGGGLKAPRIWISFTRRRRRTASRRSRLAEWMRRSLSAINVPRRRAGLHVPGRHRAVPEVDFHLRWTAIPFGPPRTGLRCWPTSRLTAALCVGSTTLPTKRRPSTFS